MSAKAEPSSRQTLQKGHIYHTGRCKQSPKAIVHEMLGRFPFLCCMQLDSEKLNIQNSHSATDSFFFFFLSFFPDSSTSDSDSDISDLADLSFFFFGVDSETELISTSAVEREMSSPHHHVNLRPGYLTLELSSYLFGIPNDISMQLRQILIKSSIPSVKNTAR